MFRYLYVFLLIFPLFVIPVYGNTVVVRMGLLVYVCLSLWIALFLKKQVRKKLHLPEIFLVLYAVWAAISTVLSDHPLISLFGMYKRHEGLLALYSYFTCYYMAVRFAPLEKYKRLLVGLIGTSIIAGVYGLLQKFFVVPGITKAGSISSFFGNPNFYGSYLVLMLVLAIVLAMLANGRKIVLFYSGASMLLFLNMMYSWTRSALVGTFMGLVFFTVFLWRKHPGLRKRYLAVLLSLLFVFGAVNLLQGSTYMQRITSIFGNAGLVLQDSSESGSAGSHRWRLWELALPLAGKYPIFGSGPDTLAYVFDQDAYCKSINIPNCQVDKAHNEYLQIAITMGIPSLVFYFMFLGTVSWRIWIAVRTSQGERQLLLAGYLTVIIGYAVQAFFNISVVPVAPYFWLMLGMGYRLAQDETKRQS